MAGTRGKDWKALLDAAGRVDEISREAGRSNLDIMGICGRIGRLWEVEEGRRGIEIRIDSKIPGLLNLSCWELPVKKLTGRQARLGPIVLNNRGSCLPSEPVFLSSTSFDNHNSIASCC